MSQTEGGESVNVAQRIIGGESLELNYLCTKGNRLRFKHISKLHFKSKYVFCKECQSYQIKFQFIRYSDNKKIIFQYSGMFSP